MTQLPPEMETQRTQVGSGWADKDGFVGPYPPGQGPRSDPRGAFPTGPEVGEQLPDFQCLDVHGNKFEFASHAHDKPTVLVFFRSAVW